MMGKEMHIVFLDNPLPADYGGAIDMYFKAKALKELGYSLTLHVFEYGRQRQDSLNELGQVFYYKRKRSFSSLFSLMPFIVKTRQSKKLINRLLKDSNPVLLEGIHSCFYLDTLKKEGKKVIVRAHNIEHNYYRSLISTASLIKRWYYCLEAIKLKSFEKKLKSADFLWTISNKDQSFFSQLNKNAHLLPPCFDIEDQNTDAQTEPYVLFHGNLSVEENKQVALDIVSACKKEKFKVIIAGKNPDDCLKQELVFASNISLIENPENKELKKLISNARIQVLMSPQATGAKLKLLIGLCGNGHVIANKNILSGTDLEPFCILLETIEQINELIGKNIHKELNKSELIDRVNFLKSHYNVQQNLSPLLNLLNKLD